MTIEAISSKEKLQPNVILNRAVNFYILKAVEDGLFKQKSDPKIALGIIEHLAKDPSMLGNTLPIKSENFQKDKDLVMSLGNLAFQAYSNRQDIKDLARGQFDPRLIAYAPQALLLYSYLPLLENLKDIANGTLQYGFGKNLNRLQPHNSLAAGEMMKVASARIADYVVNLADQKRIVDDLAILELGCGNASFSASVVSAFENKGLRLPTILATDLDPKTQQTAKQLFTEKGILKNLNVMKVDMGNEKDLHLAAQKLTGKAVIVHIGYILHENRVLAQSALSGLTKVFAGKKVIYAFSEYYIQENVSPEIPLWFQTIHSFTQELFERQHLIDFIQSYNLFNTSELVHNTRKDTGEVINSTTFWEGKSK